MTQQERIRVIFLRGAESYGLGEAARLLGITPAALRREAEQDRWEEYRNGRTWRFKWRHVACIAFRTWTLAEIHEALGVDATKVLPPLLALRAVTVSLPEFIIRALETLAAREGTTLDGYLHQELMDFAGSWADEMESIHRGYRRAYLFPGHDQSGAFVKASRPVATRKLCTRGE